MPKVTPAHEQRRRDQILDAAMACFARHGYRASSMEDIVRESGLSIGALYTYFPSKEDLFLALAEQRMQQTLGHLRELFQEPGPLAAKAGRAVDHFFEELSADLVPYARISIEFWSEASRSERLRARQAERCETMRQFLQWVIREGQREGDLREDLDAVGAAELLIALNDGLLMMHVAGLRTLPIDSLKAAYIVFVNHALARPGRAFVAPDTAVAARNGLGTPE